VWKTGEKEMVGRNPFLSDNEAIDETEKKNEKVD
jgi:hypothetical protein